MGAETPFYMLAILAVGAVMGLGVSQFVRRVVGDRNAFQLRMQSEQLQKQSREMREQAERLEELETGRLRADVAQARRAERHKTQLEQLTAIRNQIAEKLEQMTSSTGSQGSSALVAATEQLLRQHERTERERQERDRVERERLERDRIEREQAERARSEEERAERMRWMKERDERDQADRERWERERAERDQAERDRVAREERERAERLARDEKDRAARVAAQPEALDPSRSEAAIRSLLDPITATLSRFDQKLAAIEDNRRQSLGAILQHLEQVARVHADVRDETRRLARALETSPKAFGPWGDHQLRNILDLAGMTPYVDIVPTDPERVGESTDTVLRLPGDRRLVIDRSLPTRPYLDAVSASDPAVQDRALAEHAATVRHHLERLGSDEYRQNFDPRPELTVMFLPAENLLGAALAKDPALFEDGVRRQVLMATPTTLVALARSIAHSWEQERSLDNMRELAAVGTELLDRMAAIGEQVDALGRGLETSVRSYNSFVGDLQNSVMGHLRRLRELAPGARKRELHEPQQVDLTVRAPRRRRSFVITQAGQEAAAAIATRTPEGPPIPAPARSMAPADIEPTPVTPEAPRWPVATPVDPF